MAKLRASALGIPFTVLYGEHREPTREMLQDLDLFLIDLQDIGARYYNFYLDDVSGNAAPAN